MNMKRLLCLVSLVLGLGSLNAYAQEDVTKAEKDAQQEIKKAEQDLKSEKKKLKEEKKKLKEEKKKQEEAKVLEEIGVLKEIIDGKKYIIYCDRMQTNRGRSRTIGREHTLEMDGDIFKSSLPYMGVARGVTSYDGLNILDFEKEYTNYKCKVTKKGKIVVTFNIRNGQELLDYSLTFYANGSVDVYINPMRRDPVSFSGEMGYKRKLIEK